MTLCNVCLHAYRCSACVVNCLLLYILFSLWPVSAQGYYVCIQCCLPPPRLQAGAIGALDRSLRADRLLRLRGKRPVIRSASRIQPLPGGIWGVFLVGAVPLRPQLSVKPSRTDPYQVPGGTFKHSPKVHIGPHTGVYPV